MPTRMYLRWAMATVLLVAAFAAPGAALADGNCGSSYVVQWGDTLSSISQKCGLSVEAIVQMNPGAGSGVYPGQTLWLGDYPYYGYPGGNYGGSSQSGSNCYSNGGMIMCFTDSGSASYQGPGYNYNYHYPYAQYQYLYDQYQYQNWYGCHYGNCYWNPYPYEGGCSGSDCDEPEAGDPVSFVRWYFTAVWQTRDYDSLWDLQTSRFQRANSPGGFSDYTKWWDSVSYVTVHSASLVHKTSSTASVNVVLSFNMKNGRALSHQSYTYSLLYDEGMKSWKFK